MQKRFNASKYPFLAELGLSDVNKGCYRRGEWVAGDGGLEQVTVNPHNNETVAMTQCATIGNYQECIQAMAEERKKWMMTPAPVRGEIVRQIGEAMRAKKDALGALVTLEMGKIRSEGLGEVQEMIDVCDMAVGMSRTIDGKVLNSERPGHFMMEVWNPVGNVGVITAFNFPVAVMGWNTCIGLICGDQVIWKGALTASLVTVALGRIVTDVLAKHGWKSVLTVVTGDGPDIGNAIVQDPRVPLVSFTGSTAVGRSVSADVHKRFGKTILELGGNNAAIIMPDADLELAFQGAVFAAVGTCGQRCTTLRRIFLHESIYDSFVQRMVKAYKTVAIGDPMDGATLMGPMHNQQGVDNYLKGVAEIKRQGGRILTGGNKLPGPGNYVEPTIAEIAHDAPIVQTEIFAPIVYVFKFKTLDEVIEWQNEVPQGLSSALFTKNLQNYFKWVGPLGSDCGLVNCNIGTSGAEIGGAFGGEKETGGGRESGSDAWKQYMRRATCTVNYSDDLPLAQGVVFKL